jgi:hypothetical protein
MAAARGSLMPTNFKLRHYRRMERSAFLKLLLAGARTVAQTRAFEWARKMLVGNNLAIISLTPQDE